jgi:4-hydroxybenzoyl-CoA thioesterase
MKQTFTKQEKIRFKHVDYAGIVFYPRFLEMLNDLVEDWFEEALDRPFSKIHETNGIPTVDLKVQFKKAARIGELLTKKLWVINVGISNGRDAIKAEPFSEDMKTKILKYQID